MVILMAIAWVALCFLRSAKDGELSEQSLSSKAVMFALAAVVVLAMWAVAAIFG